MKKIIILIGILAVGCSSAPIHRADGSGSSSGDSYTGIYIGLGAIMAATLGYLIYRRSQYEKGEISEADWQGTRGAGKGISDSSKNSFEPTVKPDTRAIMNYCRQSKNSGYENCGYGSLLMCETGKSASEICYQKR
jgi:hypothetical protein